MQIDDKTQIAPTMKKNNTLSMQLQCPMHKL